jgi:integrase-like protein
MEQAIGLITGGAEGAGDAQDRSRTIATSERALNGAIVASDISQSFDSEGPRDGSVADGQRFGDRLDLLVNRPEEAKQIITERMAAAGLDIAVPRSDTPPLTEAIDSPHVFCHLAGVRAGKRFSYGGFYKAWKRAVRAAGVARVPHDFRRTAIRNLERDGVPRSLAMAMVGQKTEEVYRRYSSRLPRALCLTFGPESTRRTPRIHGPVQPRGFWSVRHRRRSLIVPPVPETVPRSVRQHPHR